MNTITRFFQSKIAPGLVLCLATLLAILCKNSSFEVYYEALKQTPVIVQIGSFIIDKPLLLWINDGLMAIFFLMVGLEIKRELIEGHLADKGKRALPIVAASGGIILPALIYSYINWGNSIAMQGWAIPAATDIAFALGVMLLLSDKVPASLKVCLVAIAILDDLAAIIIIALFYSAEISTLSLTLGTLGLFIAFIMNRCGVSKIGPYMIVGLFSWACVLKSGVHATLAGVALGMIVPLKTPNPEKSPLKTVEHALHPWVVFFILPLFAFSNAGLPLTNIGLKDLLNPITLGIIFGLLVGKQLGVMLFTYLAVKVKLASLPKGVCWQQYYGMAILTGIGFTMSLFIGTLAFSNLEYTSSVRLGVLVASFLSALSGYLFLTYQAKK